MNASLTAPAVRRVELRGAGASPAVIDAGVGNLGNLARALAAVGSEPRITRDPQAVARSRTLVLPGVGAFRPPRETLRGELEDALRSALAEGAYLLGICVGFQLFFEGSDEHGLTDGLGLLPGRVERLPQEVPVPHIGWNRLRVEQEGHPLLSGVADGAHVYFVHGYAPASVPEEVVLASTLHGRRFPAVVGRGRVMGTQFHPEKSGETGLSILASFLEMADGSLPGN